MDLRYALFGLRQGERIDDSYHDSHDVEGVRPVVCTHRHGSLSDSMRLCQCHEGQYLGEPAEEKDLY